MILEINNIYKNKKNSIKLLIAFVISLFFVTYALKDFDYILFLQSIRNANYYYIIFSIFILLITIQLRAMRWRLLLGEKIEVNNLYIAQLIGCMGNNLMPLRFGELLKSFYLEKKINISKYTIFGSVVLERVLDLFGVVIMFILLFNFQLFNKINTLYTSMIISMIIFSIVLLFISIYFKNINKSLLQNKFSTLTSNLLEGFFSLKVNNLLSVFVITLFIWMNYILVVYFVQKAFILNLDLNQSILLLLLSTVALSIPALPGNIGTFEGAVVYTLSLYGIEDNFGFGFILHSVSFIPYTLLGLIYFIKERKIIFNE